MRNKATHSGTCQCCGRSQRLPNGLLSQHGYIVEWGCFEGVCPGSNHEPFEVSCDLVKEFIESARRQREVVIEDQARLRQPATEPKAWVYHYHSGRFVKKGGYRWHQVEVHEKTITIGNDGYTFVQQYYVIDGEEHKINTYGQGGKDRLSIATYLNQKRVDSLQREVDGLERYIAWQTERVATWKHGVLQPVTE